MIQFHKLPNLEDLKLLYYDLRDRLKEKYTKPVGGIPASDLAPGVIPDIGLIENEKAPIIMETASGNPIVITDGAAGLPLSECKLTLLPRQSGSGDASPENVRPLIPWENVGMWTSGANTWNEQWEIGTISVETGENVVANDRIRAKDYNPCIPSKAYYIVDPTHGKNIRLFYYDKNKTFIDVSSWSEGEITTPSNAYFFRFIVAASYGTVYNNDIAINYPASVTTYNPAVPHPVDLSSITPAVYGCEINPITGEVWWIVDEPVMAKDIPFYMVSNGVFAFQKNYDGAHRERIACTAYKTATYTYWNQMNDLEIMGIDLGTIFRIRDDRFSTETDFRNYLTQADVKIVFPSTPVLLATLSPQEIETLLGTNTIWSDANSIDVEYRADTELFINQNGVKDVKVNGTSVLNDGVANVPLAGSNDLGVARVKTAFGLQMTDTNNETIAVQMASSSELKSATNYYKPVVPASIHQAVFWGLSKAAGANLASESVAFGTYPDAAKQAIQKMLGLDGLIGPYEADITADQPYAIGETFVMDGKRYKATAAIAQGGIITPGTNCELDPLDGDFVKAADYKALPTVAAADNGKILQVVNGEWAAATIPNANGVSF